MISSILKNEIPRDYYLKKKKLTKIVDVHRFVTRLVSVFVDIHVNCELGHSLFSFPRFFRSFVLKISLSFFEKWSPLMMRQSKFQQTQ